MAEPNSFAVDKTDFTHNIRVSWADCDPANIAYTGRIPYFALEAIDAWWDHFIDHDWFRLNKDLGIGTPFVHMSLDFRSPITPRHRLECSVTLIRLGNRSIRHRVLGRQNNLLCFEGEFVSVFVAAEDMEPRQPPPEIKLRLQAQLE